MQRNSARAGKRLALSYLRLSAFICGRFCFWLWLRRTVGQAILPAAAFQAAKTPRHFSPGLDASWLVLAA